MTVQLPFEQPHLLQPPPVLRGLQDQGAIHRVRTRVGHEAWLVTGYAYVRDLLADDRLGRSHPDPDRAARTGESVLFGGPMGDFDTERADHARMRALLQPQFSPKRMRAFRPRVEELTTRLLDRLTSPADLHEALAVPLPILVICELLGVPYEDRGQFRAWSQAAGDVLDRDRSNQGLADLFEYGRRLVARKRERPGDDFISRLCAEGVPDEEVAMMAMFMLFAGHETTVVAIGMGALWLLTHPDQHRALVDDPALLTSAVEEMLRAPDKGGGGIPRYARVDIELDGVTIRAGELVLLDTGAANHDADAFRDPDRFEVGRQGTAHLTFGHGAHYCLGAPLARIELQAVFSQLVPRFPAMRLAVPVEELRVRTDVLTGGLVELPVEW
ncbi:cytochrome P450 [Nonomuraea africana]|uniref:Pentalenolactone synthase n=1 Tax=Nonomuraea africana TaxID=46171 RepID=A0ABR9KGR6_9ACTN|nr:cytochrome P450 [Nonomuraea africana]MBE1561201.1 pentalenolactone synthase [Nonomuraea africana]